MSKKSPKSELAPVASESADSTELLTNTTEVLDLENRDIPPQNSSMPVFEDSGLMDALKGYDTRVEDALSEWHRLTTTAVLEPLAEVVASASDAATSLLNAFESSDADSPAACRIQAIRYRRDSRRRVLTPLIKHLESDAPSFQAANQFIALLHELESASTELPTSSNIVDHSEGFPAEPADTLFMRLKKWNYRRRIRSASDSLSRPVPVRQLAEYNSTIRVTQYLTPLHEDLQKSIAQYIAGVERAIADWSVALYTLERPLDEHVRDRMAAGMLRLVKDVELEDGANEEENGVDELTQEAEDARTEEIDAMDSVVDNVRSVTKEFVSAIAGLAEIIPVVELPKPQAINGSTRALRMDIQQYGTPFLDTSTRIAASDSASTAKARTTLSTWLRWNQQVCNRFVLYDRTLILRETMTDAERAILSDVARLSIQPLNEIFERIKKVFSESAATTQEAATTAQQSKDLVELRRTIERVKTSNNRFLSRTLHDLPGMVSADDVLSDPSAKHWPSVLAVVEASPAELVIHELVEAGKPIDPEERIRTIAFRDRLGEAIQPVSKRFKTAADPLRKALQHIWSDVEKTKTSVIYNLDTSSSELARIIGGNYESDEEGANEDSILDDTDRGIQRTTELAIKGYERAGNALDELLPLLREPWNSFSETVLEEIQQQWLVAIRKARTGTPDETDWEGISVTARRAWHRFQTGVVEIASGLSQRARSVFVTGRRRLRKLIRIGQTAVGAIEASDEDLTRTLDELVRISEMRRDLPLVYRHLFALEPLIEPVLFEGRARDLAKIKDQLQRWADGERSGSIVLTAFVGSGRTTFLNMISCTMLQDIPHEFVRPTKRMQEGALSRLLAEAVSVSLPKDDDSFDALEAAIIEKGVPDTPVVCLIDDFEHLFMRSADGVEIVKRLLVLMSRTDTCVFWIAAVGDLAWRYLTSVAGAVTTYPTVQPITSVTREILESIVMTRHKRSSIPMRFFESKAQTDAMWQWLTRSRSDKEKQEFARAQYFDRLFRYSGQNIMLALYYWIRFAKFSENGDSIEVQQLDPLKFDTLTRFSMAQAFSLEAFLFHKTLSLAEHNQALRLDDTEGAMLIEALLNARLLIRVRVADEEREATISGRILPNDRFQIRPLLIHPVRVALSQRHLVY